MNEKHNKFQPDRKLFSICIYLIITVFICAAFVKCIWSWSTTAKFLSGLFSTISPFLLGFFIAYIMDNIMKGLDKHLLTKYLKLKNLRVRKIVSLIMSYIIVFALIVGAMFYIIPSFIDGLSDIANSVNDLYKNLLKYIDDLTKQYSNPTLDNMISGFRDNMPKYLTQFQDWVASLAPRLADASMSVIKGVFNLIVAIIVSIYILLDKHILKITFKKSVYSVFSKERSDYIWKTCQRANEIFSGFIIGKTIDSFIIGVLCFILMNVFSLGGPFAGIISMFVGITNMIPYFGPFIGAIPSALVILLSVSPEQALWFCVLILGLQQFDGNILGPYILGDRTGLRPIWILFAITVGGWIGGIIGMFLGVPCIALAAAILDDFVKYRLKEKKLEHLFFEEPEEQGPGYMKTMFMRLIHYFTGKNKQKASSNKKK